MEKIIHRFVDRLKAYLLRRLVDFYGLAFGGELLKSVDDSMYFSQGNVDLGEKREERKTRFQNR